MSTRVVKQISFRDHVRTRSMWAGDKSSQQIETWLYECHGGNDKFVMSTIRYPPVLYKIIDEIVVNAIDHHKIFPDVKTLDITIEQINGVPAIIVYNDGPGIDIVKTTTTSGV